MKKILFGVAITAVSMTAITSCSDDTETKKLNPDLPSVSAGAFILNQGQYYNGIEGSLNAIDYKTETCSKDLFQTVNNRSLGDTPQCGVAYGSKIYLGICFSNTIEIIEKSNYKSIKQIKLGELDFGNEPRSVVATKGCVYFAMNDGKVARLDTLTLNFDGVVEVGPNPEVMALHNNKLYVPNSDGNNYPNYGTTATEVSLDAFGQTKTFTVPLNPYKFLSAAGKLFMIAKGDYTAANPGALYEISDSFGATKIADATMGCTYGNYVYFINAPYGGDISRYQYSKYDAVTGKTTGWGVDPVEYPLEINIDPVSGHRIISSAYLDGAYPSYSLPGYAYEYDANDRLVKKYNVGVGPAWIFFNVN